MGFKTAINMAFLTLWVLLNMFSMAWNHRMAGGGPVILDHPFITIWNAPSQECQEKYNVSLDLGIFDVVLNQNETFVGRDITLFYSNRLGYYPYYTENGTAVNGGIPQNASLKNHLWKVQQDIKETILEAGFKGLAVVDWESWRPLWVRNWESMQIYQNKSIDLVKEQHPDWPADKVAKEAQLQFEKSSRAFMEQTLALGKALRPKGFWGFYGFPGCYNYEYKNASYTGECPEIEKQRNEELQWLWNQSQALYPSIYLPKELRFLNKTLQFVRHRVQEAFRIVNRTENGSIPVLPYASISYEFTQNFLSQEALVHTIGESASQGTAGVILWGSKNYSYSEEACLDVKKYVDTVLGPYIINVTSSTRLCNQILCSKHGRCVRQDEHPEAFLHLASASFSIKRHHVEPHFILMGQMSKKEQVKMAKEFTCQCYSGWEGLQCEKKSS
ncbi:hyaluronidase-1 [Rhineura floridana]|uniref:hyaluronidase-1 n=1 Tax=Rhineura floridana TaxID=261503 RepID=UPI002AC87EF5|nr:hyaluronidase-1 [Rhineura floridana]XP_061473828.1 hyaluronidase-1 [Rhineura floridana]XP_061473829.1 hyaluronidase-1 [Rhineura floridana]XP_061473830.1 hyaluronidase-1 [Rhineura floridana]XP_061473831.1 hyaluronidase-1 [Rhineura floridana]